MVERVHASDEVLSTKYLLGHKDFSPQFSHVYNNRLTTMKSQLQKRAVQKWGSDFPILSKIIDSESQEGECIIIGTIFKDMKQRNSVLDEFKDNIGATGTAPISLNWACKDDKLLLEDDSGRILLSGLIEAHLPLLVTGVVIAAKGRESELGVFEITDWITTNELEVPESFVGELEHKGKIEPSLLKSLPPEEIEPEYILLVSGLRLSNNSENVNLSLQMLADFIAGRLGSERETYLASRIIRVIIAGDSLDLPKYSLSKEKLTAKSPRSTSDPSKQLDMFLSTILGCCHVDVIPGATDPASVSLPQQPLHSCLLPHAARFSSLRLVTNPYEVSIGGVVVTGHSGQPVHDILRQTLSPFERIQTEQRGAEVDLNVPAEFDSIITLCHGCRSETEDMALAALVNTFTWGHLCPTAPDTLACHPYSDGEPFVLIPTEAPLIYFAGNQAKFSCCRHLTTEKRDVRFVCVPSFHETQQVVLVDVKSLKCDVVSFDSFE